MDCKASACSARNSQPCLLICFWKYVKFNPPRKPWLFWITLAQQEFCLDKRQSPRICFIWSFVLYHCKQWNTERKPQKWQEDLQYFYGRNNTAQFACISTEQCFVNMCNGIMMWPSTHNRNSPLSGFLPSPFSSGEFALSGDNRLMPIISASVDNWGMCKDDSKLPVFPDKTQRFSRPTWNWDVWFSRPIGLNCPKAMMTANDV